jgi:PKD repeat protein
MENSSVQHTYYCINVVHWGITMNTGTKDRWRKRAQAQVPWPIFTIILIAVIVVPVQAELNPAFIGKPLSGVSPLTVQFNDTSTGFVEPVTYLWDFGDGNISSEKNPLYTYNSPGSFRVKLVIQNASGDEATLSQNNYITVEAPFIPDALSPDFNATPRSGVSPLTVQFNDASTGPFDHWDWDFGDGNTSTEQNPVYTYDQLGSYAVTLNISNVTGELATINKKNYITVEAPVIPDPLSPDFNATPRSGVSPLTVQFNDASTGPLDHWDWDFGDGNMSTEQNPVYTYYGPGLYSVTLIISNTSGDQATITQSNYIAIEPAATGNEIILDFTGIPRSGISPLTVQFNDTSTGFFEPLTYFWDFGDGGTSTERNPVYTYSQQGSYSVTLNVNQSAGAPISITKNNFITITTVPLVLPRANFSGYPTNGIAPLTVSFMDTSTNTTSWNWSFGDNSLENATEQNPVHTFVNLGTYTISLNASNTDGSDTKTRSKYITVEIAPAAQELILDFNGTPRSGINPLTVQFNDTSTGFVEPVSYLWDFGDGGTSIERNPVYTYSQQGSYSVTLNVNQSIGTPASITKHNFITSTSVPLILPVADFTGDPTSGIAPLTVSFADTSANTSSWNWSFDDNSLENATEQNPIHTYTNPGIYTVSLNASNTDGSDTKIRSKYITVNPVAGPLEPPVPLLPVANFSGTPISGVAPLTITFTDVSTNTPTSWNWSFGEDSLENATEQNPVHTFTNPGTYTVSLNATNGEGSDTKTRSKYITVNPVADPLEPPVPLPPVTNFSGTPISGDAPLTVTFTDISTNSPSSWNWSFGEDSLENATEQNPVHTFANPGIYTVSLNASNTDGSDTKILTDYITISSVPIAPQIPEPQIPEPLIPNFTGTPTSGPSPLSVQFNDTSTGLHDQWVWEFGDGNTSSKQNPMYVYNEPGSYSVILNVGQTGGEQATITQQDYVTVVTLLIPEPLNREQLIPNFTGMPTSGPAPLTIQFNDTSTGPHDQWEWNFGDGNSSLEQNPLYTYNEPGLYSVILNVSQTGGDSISTTQQDYITVSAVPSLPPVADFSGKPNSGIAPLTVTFTDLSTNLPSTWNWSFGDDSAENATEQNPVHTYVNSGNYTVSLNSTNAAGLNVTTKTNYINVTTVPTGAVADFSGTPTFGLSPLTVQFNDTSTGFVEPVTYFWDFGDGSNSTERNPSHSYTANIPENYTVTLNVTGNYGKTGSMIKPEYISIEIPTIELILTEEPLDDTLPSNEPVVPTQTLPQAQSLPMTKSGLQAQSLTSDIPREQDPSLPNDISQKNNLLAVMQGPNVDWTLNRGENIKNDSFSMIVHSTVEWRVDVYDDASHYGKPGTPGKMSEYDYLNHIYFNDGYTLQNALHLQTQQFKTNNFGPEVILSGTPTPIQTGNPMVTPWDPFKYYINLKQQVDNSDHPSSQNRGYRIVITFEAWPKNF